MVWKHWKCLLKLILLFLMKISISSCHVQVHRNVIKKFCIFWLSLLRMTINYWGFALSWKYLQRNLMWQCCLGMVSVIRNLKLSVHILKHCCKCCMWESLLIDEWYTFQNIPKMLYCYTKSSSKSYYGNAWCYCGLAIWYFNCQFLKGLQLNIYKYTIYAWSVPWCNFVGVCEKLSFIFLKANFAINCSM